MMTLGFSVQRLWTIMIVLCIMIFVYFIGLSI